MSFLVYLGANAVVLGPAKIGDGAVIGAGAVVVSNVAEGMVVVGVPARELKRSPEADLIRPNPT